MITIHIGLILLAIVLAFSLGMLVTCLCVASGHADRPGETMVYRGELP